MYVSGDHPAVARMLNGNFALSTAIRALFRHQISWIHWNGSVLRIRTPYAAVPLPTWGPHLEVLTRHLLALPKGFAGRIGATLGDRFERRVLILEAIAYGILGYGIGGLIDLFFTRDKIHFMPGELFQTGLVFGGGLFVVFFFVTLLSLVGGSRAPRLIADVLLIMLTSCGVACYQIAADLNTQFDKGPSLIVEATVAAKHIRTSRSRRGSTTYRYYLALAPKTVEIGSEKHALPQEIQVSSFEYNAATTGTKVDLTVWPGKLGFPWIWGTRNSPILLANNR